VLGPVTCPACGAKVREDRVRCLRCSAPLAGRPQAPPPSADSAAVGARSYRLPLIAVAAVVVVGGLVYVTSGDEAAENAAAGAAPSVASGASAAGTTAVARTNAPAPVSPEPVVVAMDASRAGIAAYNSGDLTGSVDSFQAAVNADPQRADALNNLGQVLVRSGRVAEAIPYFDRAIAASSGVWAYHFNRARAYAELQQWNRAASGYRNAARLFPDDYVTTFNLARALEADGRLSEAIGEYERAVALAPGEPDFYLSLAFALETARRPAEALAVYRQYLELEESPPQAEKIKARIAEIEAQS